MSRSDLVKGRRRRYAKAVTPEEFRVKGVFKNTCVSLFFKIKLQAEKCNFIKQEYLAQMPSCEFR